MSWLLFRLSNGSDPHIRALLTHCAQKHLAHSRPNLHSLWLAKLQTLKSNAGMQLEEAAAMAPRAENGISIIESSEQFDALLVLHPDKEVVLLAGLSWCRPCKGLTRPLEKLSVQYKDGAVFAKVMGDHNDSTKRLFKNRLKVRWTALRQSGVC